MLREERQLRQDTIHTRKDLVRWHLQLGRTQKVKKLLLAVIIHTPKGIKQKLLAQRHMQKVHAMKTFRPLPVVALHMRRVKAQLLTVQAPIAKVGTLPQVATRLMRKD